METGGIEQVKEATRDAWVREGIATFARDLRFTLRGLRARPVFSTAVIATIALGIGANAAIFSAVDRLLFRAPPLLREPALTHRIYLAFPMPDGDGEFFMESEPYSRYVELTDWTSFLTRTALASTRDLAVGDAARRTEVVRRALQNEMPGVSYVTVTPYSEIVDEQARPWRLGVAMFVAFGLVALVLAAVGLYAVIAYDSEQRSREIGIRIALGARPARVVWLVVRQGMLLAALGIAIGGGITIGVAGRLEPLLFDVSARDPLVYAAVAITMLVVAAAACFAPARRATRVDPNVALRSD